MEERGWEACDFVFVSGDAYIDHPSFAAALICRLLEDAGFRVGIIPQPDWKNPESYAALGRPRFGFLAGSGNMDSMTAHYTAAKRRRSGDAYSPGGKAGLRPDRALLVYVEGIRRLYKNVPVITGGIEASLRRFAHYDYWSGMVRRSILLDSKADILVYGMGEKPLLEIARRLSSGETIGSIDDVRGTCVRTADAASIERREGVVKLPAYAEVSGGGAESLRAYAEHFMLQKHNADPAGGRPLAEQSDGGRWVIQNPPAFPLNSAELDHLYELPFTRQSHPAYDAAGGVPALQEVVFSLTANRGCFGGCSFCAITFHQGRAVTARSGKSLVREAKTIAALNGFKGYIHDAGGPTANFYGPACEKQRKGAFCAGREGLYPRPCPQLQADHGPYLETLRALRSSADSEGIKKIFIRSGIRFDFIQLDTKHGKEFLETLCRYHVSGQLKTAPEHVSAAVLDAMGKCGHDCYTQFKNDYETYNRRLGLKQYLIPYFISAHPGADLAAAIELALYLKKTGFVPDQIQDFYPTPGTLSTVMYYTGLDPRNMRPVYTAKGGRERRLQRALLHFNRRENRKLIIEALKEAGREDLIGGGSGCLIR
jgi:uncharacterized radical SAM protein YgiQ